MLLDLRVRNLALIDKVNVEFGDGLNIMTGETGAGKSIIIGSVNIALGGKAPRDIIRQGAEYAYIELVFSVTDEAKIQALKSLNVEPDDDGILIISKKIMPARSVSRINDETVTSAKLREITSLLIDVHGQHEHQSLLYKSKHLEILDAYSRHQTQSLQSHIHEVYHDYIALGERLQYYSGDQENRLREIDFLRFEIEEIENAALKEGEEEELTLTYRRYANAQKIMGSLSAAHEAVQSDDISNALRAVSDVVEYDEKLKGIQDQLFDLETLLSDVNREISDYMDDQSYDEEAFTKTEARLDLIRSLESKYGGSVEQVMHALEEKKERLEDLEHADELREQAQRDLERVTKELDKLCTELSEKRQEASKELTQQIQKGLEDLNFLHVNFTMEFTRMDHYTSRGFDEAEFKISTNPGEPVKSLGSVASGGELSRIMLAIKTVLADSDDIPTLIFDEIDTGISGRTAQKVSEKLAYIAKSHQVICITHLPQIAAMADTHFEIAKSVEDDRTTTRIQELKGDGMVTELARMLGGAEITDTVLQNAQEMKALAQQAKRKS